MHDSGDEQLSHLTSHGSAAIHEKAKEITENNKALTILFIYLKKYSKTVSTLKPY